MNDLRKRIAALSDRDTIEVVAFVNQSMQADLRQRTELPADVQSTILTDNESVNLLSDTFPQLSTELEKARSTASTDERGIIARNLLLVLSEEEQYAGRVEKTDHIDQM